jgi:hypothetical protein
MELLSMVHMLRNRRLLLAVGLVASLAFGAKVSGAFGSGGAGPTVSGQAFTRVLVDTPAPLLATSVAKGADTVVQRTVLLAALMGSSRTAAAIARLAGVPYRQLAVVGPALDPVTVDSYSPAGQFPLSASTAAAVAGGLERFVVELTPVSTEPIISVGTSAPTAREATALAQATVATLTSTSAAASGGDRTLRIESIDPVRAAPVRSASSSHHMLGAALAFAVFLVWCLGIALLSGVARRWHGAGRTATDGVS